MSQSIKINLIEVHAEHVDKANKFLESLPAMVEYNKVVGMSFGFVCQKDLDWCKSEECNDEKFFTEYFLKRFGQCEIQYVSSLEDNEELLVSIVKSLYENFEIEIEYNESFFDKDSFYLSLEQQRVISKNGELLYTDWDDDELKENLDAYINRDLMDKSYEEFYGINVNATCDSGKAVAFMQQAKENKNFYPTPKSLVELMLDKVNFKRGIKTVLEPSAGKADIINFAKEYKASYERRDREYNYTPLRDTKFSAIEIDPMLQATLRGQCIEVIDSDFLTYNGLEQFDLILMNPPFDMGAQHLHKALDILFSGQIVCLLNAETIKNPYTNERKRLIQRLKQLDATIDYVEGAFEEPESDRTTSVETALVYINVEKTVETEYFENLKEDEFVFDEEVEQNKEIEGLNKVANLVIEYNREREMVINQIMDFYKNYKRVSKYLKLTVAGNTDEEKEDTKKDHLELTRLMKSKVNSFSRQIKKDYWLKAIELDEVKKRLTSSNRSFVHLQLERASAMEFTESNVYQFIINIIDKFPELIQQSIEALFDEFTRYAVQDRYDRDDYIGNVHYFSGWKTNDAYKVNKKVIQPFYRDTWDWEHGGGIPHKYRETMQDMDMVISYFDVYNESRRTYAEAKIKSMNLENEADALKDYEKFVHLGTAEIVDNALREGNNRKIDTPYFIINVYKKGTVHIEFKDMEILRRFNIAACKGKNFIPDDYSRKPFEDLSQEEKDLVHEFEPVSEYKVLASEIAIEYKPMSTLALELKPKDEPVQKKAVDFELAQDIDVETDQEQNQSNETGVITVCVEQTVNHDAYAKGTLF